MSEVLAHPVLEPNFPDDEITVRATEHEAQHNLVAVLRLCATGKLRCSEKTRRPSAATVDAVAEVLAGGDFYGHHAIAAFAWPALVQAGGLAELAGGRLQLTAQGRKALTAPPADTIRHLWRRWVSHAPYDEMSRIDHIKGQRSTRALTAAKPRRQVVAEALASCTSSDWTAIDQLFRRMQQQGLHPAVARDPWKLYLLDPYYGSLGYDGYHAWSTLEGRYTLCVLFEYAATLGLLDVTYTHPEGARDDFRGQWGSDDLDALSRYDGLLEVRLNALGAYVCGLAPTYRAADDAKASEAGLKVLPNLDVVVTGELRSVDRLVLDAFAERRSDRVWALGVDTLLAALDGGRSLAKLRQFLETQASTALPSTVTTLLADVAARADRLKDLGVVRVVECSDAAVAALIVGDRRIGRYCRSLGDRHIAIPPGHDAAFRKALRARGYVLRGEAPS